MTKKKLTDDEEKELFNKLMGGAGRLCRLGMCEKVEIIFPRFGISITYNKDGSWRGLTTEIRIIMKDEKENSSDK